ncbi:MAG: phage tail protein, partial [Nitrospirota bacterium]
MSSPEDISRYLKYLPAIYHKEGDLLGRFLKGFEKVISGIDDNAEYPEKGIEEILDTIHDYIDPHKTPLDFLKWLAGWVALTLKEGDDWNQDNAIKKRDLIASIVKLYQKRGTRDGLAEYLKIYVGKDIDISINELIDPFQVGVTSTVGENSVVGEGRPYYFEIHMVLPAPDPVMLEKKRRAIVEIIDQEKPAHTYYRLVIRVPTM